MVYGWATYLGRLGISGIYFGIVGSLGISGIYLGRVGSPFVYNFDMRFV